jgi:hypothetical protein
MAERIVVTGARAAAALDIARDFAGAGYEVHMADCSPARISRWSRRVAKVHSYPSPVSDPGGFETEILRLRDTLAPILIVPTCEEIFHLARPMLAERLGTCLFAPPLATLAILHDKYAFADACARNGLPVPETHRLAAPADVDSYAEQSATWVFKPCFSRFGAETMISPRPDQLRAIAPIPKRPWVAQRRIAGREISFYAIARNGKLAAFAAYGAGWRLGGGAGISFDPIEPGLETGIEALAVRIAEAFRITGQFACDLIVDAAGEFWLIECNPRATSGVHLLGGGGALAQAMLGARTGLVRSSRESRHLLPALLTYGLATAVGQGRLGEWVAQLRRGSDVAGAPGDRGPALGALVDGLGFMLSGALKGTGATAATTADIEWNGDR